MHAQYCRDTSAPHNNNTVRGRAHAIDRAHAQPPKQLAFAITPAASHVCLCPKPASKRADMDAGHTPACCATAAAGLAPSNAVPVCAAHTCTTVLPATSMNATMAGRGDSQHSGRLPRCRAVSSSWQAALGCPAPCRPSRGDVTAWQPGPNPCCASELARTPGPGPGPRMGCPESGGGVGWRAFSNRSAVQVELGRRRLRQADVLGPEQPRRKVGREAVDGG